VKLGCTEVRSTLFTSTDDYHSLASIIANCEKCRPDPNGELLDVKLKEIRNGVLKGMKAEVSVLGNGTADAEGTVVHADLVFAIELAKTIESTLNFSIT
jgi:hypothetical protein